MRATAAALSLVLALTPTLGFAQTAIGNTSKVVNQVEAAAANAVRRLALRDSIFQAEVIRTSARSATELVFRDETTITIGPEAQVTLDTFVFDPDPAKAKVVVRQSIGALRFVSGKSANIAYEIRTPTATIGVRGTVFTVVVAANGLTTVTVEAGIVAVSNVAGISQTVGSGLSSSVSPAAPGAAAPPPSPPGPPPPTAVAQVNQLNTTIAQAPGTAAGTGAAEAAGGVGTGIGAGAVAAGLAIAAALAVAISAVTGQDDNPTAAATTSTTTATATATN
jgi:hypothetical protein